MIGNKETGYPFMFRNPIRTPLSILYSISRYFHCFLLYKSTHYNYFPAVHGEHVQKNKMDSLFGHSLKNSRDYVVFLISNDRFCAQLRHNVTLQYGVMTLFDSSGTLPRRWLFYFFLLHAKLSFHDKLV